MKSRRKILLKFRKMLKKIFETYSELRMIALSPSHYENQSQIMEEMIFQEQQTQKDGFEKRVKILRQLKEVIEDIQNLSSKGKSITNETQIDEFLDDLLKQSHTKRSKSQSALNRSKNG